MDWEKQKSVALKWEWVAGLGGAVIGTVWNYVATRLLTWRLVE